MRASPYGNYSNIEYEDAAGYKEGGRLDPQRYNGFPTATPGLQSADIDSDRALDRSNLTRLKNSYPSKENGNISQGTSPVPDWRRNMGEVEGQLRNTNYQEGPSNYFHGSSNSRVGESPIQRKEYDVPKSFEYLERDRAELLRKLIKLDDQLMRSASAGEQGKQRYHVERSKYHHERFGSTGDWLQENSSVLSNSLSNKQSRMTDNRFANVSPFHEKHQYQERRNLTTRDPYLSSGSYNEVKRHGENADSQFPRRGTIATPYPENSPYRSHLHLQSADTAVPRLSGSPHYHKPQHRPDCSCFQCYCSHLSSPPHVQPRSSVNTSHIGLSSNPKAYHQKDPQLAVNAEKSYSPLATGGQINHVRWPSALDFSVDEKARSYPESTTPVKVKSSIRPITGGAPFVTCSNCFQLLQVSREIMKPNNRRQKIQCVACSSLTCFFTEGKKLVFFIHKESMGKSNEIMDASEEKLQDLENFSNKAVEEMSHIRGPSRASQSFDSEEFNWSTRDTGIGDSEQVQHTTYIALEKPKEGPNISQGSSIEAVEKTPHIDCRKNEDNIKICNDHNPSGCASPLINNAPSLLSAVDYDEDDTPEEGSTGQEVLPDSDDAAVELISPSSSKSALPEHRGGASFKHAVLWLGTPSQIIRVQNEDNDSEISPRENLVREIPDETETETGTEKQQHETPKANSSLATIGKSVYEDPPNFNNGGSTTETIKERVMKMVQCDVRINERPIPDYLVKIAEDLAGPILPGDYWYDFRAGFWGVTGGPCLGIIPPKIQQFDYPLLKNCSGGTTGVVVNGRELHAKDLALLHSRGLPIERGKSYIVEISGTVQDEISGEEVRNLGPLAPTIERLKRGFGMRSKRNIATHTHSNMVKEV